MMIQALDTNDQHKREMEEHLYKSRLEGVEKQLEQKL